MLNALVKLNLVFNKFKIKIGRDVFIIGRLVSIN